MIFLTGGAVGRADVQAAAQASGGRFGAIITPRHRRTLTVLDHYPVWAADNGCAFQGAIFQLAPYLAWLERCQPWRATCLFAVAPDVIGDHAATMTASLPVLPAIRSLGFPAAFVLQRGGTPATMPWDHFDVLFVGDTNANRRTEMTATVIHAARARQRWVHLGRCNSRRAMLAAKALGCDSADGTSIAFAPDRELPKLVAGVAAVAAQMALPVELGKAAKRGLDVVTQAALEGT